MLCAIAVMFLTATSRAAMAGASPVRWKIPLGPAVAPAGVLTRLSGGDNNMALTVDDGASVSVVGSFAQFCRDTGTRLTFFVTGANPSWSVNAPALRPMVDSGQVQMANHTWSHPRLNSLGLDAVADQIRRDADFLKNTYGVHNAAIDRVAADQGYTTITMWSSTLGDSAPESEASLLANASRAFQPQQIVLAHANMPAITHCYPQLIDLIRSRNLNTVTLNDVSA